MKIKALVIFALSTVLWMPFSQALQANQKRLLQDKKSKQCFYVESVKKSKKYGWLNEKKAKQITKIKRKRVLTASSEINVRKVVVPKAWCQGS